MKRPQAQLDEPERAAEPSPPSQAELVMAGGMHASAPAGALPSDPILLMIANAARDPLVDIEKFERLMALRERLSQADARRAFYAAPARAKAKFGPIIKRREDDYE